MKKTGTRLQKIEDALPIGIFQTDENGYCIYVNPKWCEITGLTADLAKGSGWAEALHPDDKEHVAQQWYDAAKSKSEFRSEYRFRGPDGAVRWVEGRAVSIQSMGKITGYVGTITEISVRKKAEERLRFLSQATAILISSLEYQTTLQNIADLSVPFVSDYCIIDIFDDFGALKQVAIRHINREKEKHIRRIRALLPFNANADYGIEKVVRTGVPEMVIEVDQDWTNKRKPNWNPDLEELVAKMQFCSYIVVPLLGRDKILGGISFVMSESGRHYDEQDLVLLQDLASRAALSVDNARLYKESRKAQEIIQVQLQEKDVLIKEIHHRVKNNLQVTCSLLNLQAVSAPGQYKELLVETQTRIRSMAMIHEMLYRSENLASLDLSRYIVDLASILFSVYQKDTSRIRMITKCEPVSLGVDKAVPCGLIVNELLSNSLKHAFPGEREGNILIELRSKDHLSRLTVSDDGIGVPETVYSDDSSTLGLRLIKILCSQLNASIEMKRSPGTSFTISFPMH